MLLFSGAGLWPAWIFPRRARFRKSFFFLPSQFLHDLWHGDFDNLLDSEVLNALWEVKFIGSRISFTTSAQERRHCAGSASLNALCGKSLIASKIPFTTPAEERRADWVEGGNYHTLLPTQPFPLCTTMPNTTTLSHPILRDPA